MISSKQGFVGDAVRQWARSKSTVRTSFNNVTAIRESRGTAVTLLTSLSHDITHELSFSLNQR